MTIQARIQHFTALSATLLALSASIGCQPEYCEGCTPDDTDESVEHPEVPTLEFSASPIKQFDFSWAPTSGATYYRLLERTEIGGDFLQLGDDIFGQSISLMMPLHLRWNSGYQLQACNDTGCVASEPIDVTSVSETVGYYLADVVGYFKSSHTEAGDFFGDGVALSADGNTLAVAASREANTSGAIYVFERDEANVWSQTAYITPSIVEDELVFGSPTLSADGRTLVASGRGHVYVFERDDANAWTQQAQLDVDVLDAALSADGNILAVSATETQTLDVFERGGANAWIEQASFPLYFDPVLGAEVELSADGAVVAAAVPAAAWGGVVHVFERDGMNSWLHQAQLESPKNNFGRGLALAADGGTLAIASRIASTESGVVEVFRRDADVWVAEAEVTSGPLDYLTFGACMALSADGSLLAVGSSDNRSGAKGVGDLHTDTYFTRAGAVQVYRRAPGNTWMFSTFVKASNSDPYDLFGWSVALSADGNTLAVGAPGESSSATGIGGDQTDNSLMQSGAVYLY